MTIYLVDEHHRVHTCPANPAEPHSVDIRRTSLSVTPGGPCKTPVTFRFNDTAYTVPCKKQLPADRQCTACANIVWIHQTTVTDLGYQGPANHPNLLAHAATMPDVA